MFVLELSTFNNLTLFILLSIKHFKMLLNKLIRQRFFFILKQMVFNVIFLT